jgi:Tol biopolymer transport system component
MKTESISIILATALVLSACGGGGGDGGGGGGSGGGSPPPAGPATPASSSSLTGAVAAPVGTRVVLQNNLGDDLDVTVPPFAGGAFVYNEQAFRFATNLPAGSSYSVTLKARPADQICGLRPPASGTMPAAVDAVLLGCERTNELVSLNDDGSVSGSDYNGTSHPVIGGNTPASEGRYVAFTAYAFINGSSSSSRQVFRRDRLTGKTHLVSKNANGVEGNGNTYGLALSADGLHVVFDSDASNLVDGDNNGATDVFMWSAEGGELWRPVQRISVGAGGAQANGQSFDPTISADGKTVAFTSTASNLTQAVAPQSGFNVFLRDTVTGVNTLVSADANGNGVGGEKAALSEDGMRLAFWSYSPALVTGDTNDMWDIFLFDRVTGRKSRVSKTADGKEREGGSDSRSDVVAPAISGNGRFVGFATTATNMVPGDTNDKRDVFVVDTQTGNVARASVGPNGVQGNDDSPVRQGEAPSMSHDGSWVAFSSNATNFGAGAANVFMRNAETAQTRLVSAGNQFDIGKPNLSRNALYAVYGGGGALDARFSEGGLFATFTGLGRAYFWW